MSKAKEIPIRDIVNMTYEQIHEKDEFDLFFDWFCDTKSLPNKAKRLLSALRGIVRTKTGMVNPDSTYVFFKNNCPCVGGLYDDLRICDIKTGKVLFNVCLKNPWYGYKPVVAFDDPKVDRWEDPLVFDSMKDVRAWFKDPSKFKVTVKDEVIRTGVCEQHKATIHECRRAA